MKQHMEDRCVRIAKYIISTGCTVRAAAEKFWVSKTTVHIDVTQRLPYVDSNLYKEVMKVIETNKQERQYRGGIATQKKYAEIRKQKS